MPRHKAKKQITNLPNFIGYKPEGIHYAKKGSIDLLFEEFHAIDLIDYRDMNFEQAALAMNISKTSFARLIQSARKKIATAFIECKSIQAAPGDTYSDYNWYRCEECFYVAKIKKPNQIDECPSCQCSKLKNMFEK